MGKFKKTKKYKAKTLIFSPYGLIQEGTVLTGEEWENVLVYEVGNDFKFMFELVEDEK